LTFPLVKARPTFLKKIFNFSKGQADVFEKKKLALGKVRPTFSEALVKGRPTFWKKIFSFSKGQADVLEKNIFSFSKGQADVFEKNI